MVNGTFPKVSCTPQNVLSGDVVEIEAGVAVAGVAVTEVEAKVSAIINDNDEKQNSNVVIRDVEATIAHSPFMNWCPLSNRPNRINDKAPAV
jgi:hypothetical protein